MIKISSLRPIYTLWLFYFVICIPFSAFSGGSSGGGPGTGVILNNNTIAILPIYLADPNFVDTFSSGKVKLPEPMPCLYSPILLDHFSYDPCNPPPAINVPAKIALNQIEKWRCSSPTLIEALSQGIQSSFFYFVSDKDDNFGAEPMPRGYFLPPQFRSLNLTTLAYYDRDTIIRVSEKRYNLMGDTSRAAIFLWEAFREVIIANRAQITLEQQQKLVGKITITSPAPGETLETKEYIQGPLLELAEENRGFATTNCKPHRPFPMVFRNDLILKRARAFENFF